MNDLYFEHLCEMVGGCEASPGLSFYRILRILYEKPFYGILGNDSDRAEDGLDLRDGYCDRDNSPCSVLEMIIALAKRMNYIMLDDNDTDYTCDFFWRMIDNLLYSVPQFDDDNLDADRERIIYRILDRFLMRNYSTSGKGGLFPIRNPSENQRNVEISYQMNAWLLENYGGYIYE